MLTLREVLRHWTWMEWKFQVRWCFMKMFVKYVCLKASHASRHSVRLHGGSNFLKYVKPQALTQTASILSYPRISFYPIDDFLSVEVNRSCIYIYWMKMRLIRTGLRQLMEHEIHTWVCCYVRFESCNNIFAWKLGGVMPPSYLPNCCRIVLRLAG